MTEGQSTCDRATVRLANAGDVAGLPVEQAEALLPADLIHDDEIVILLLRPSLLFVVLSALGALILILILSLLLALVAVKYPQVAAWNETQAYAAGAALASLRLGWQVLEWWSRIYVLTDRRVIRRKGVIRVSVFETQLRNIQHTSVFMRLRERLFGLGSIGFATAGSDVFEAFWVMLPQPFTVHRTIVEAIQRYGKHG